jgi:hypothetical protein
VLTTPASNPVSIRTCSGIAADAAAVKAMSDAAVMKHLKRVIISPLLIDKNRVRQSAKAPGEWFSFGPPCTAYYSIKCPPPTAVY